MQMDQNLIPWFIIINIWFFPSKKFSSKMDLFKVLGSGARFNKKRFNEDITLFEVFFMLG